MVGATIYPNAKRASYSIAPEVIMSNRLA
jgi:hypothetical protein